MVVLASLGGGKGMLHQFVRIALVLIFFAFIHAHRLPELLQSLGDGFSIDWAKYPSVPT
ncbi:hypothetical protein [Rhizobium leguminosarum]|uniref:hypothetical protein n=1 Tax=Rhizobium leguminosarum TaxID=384 RepID=UPI003F9E0291